MKEQLRLQLGGSALTPIDSNVEVLPGPLRWAAAISCCHWQASNAQTALKRLKGRLSTVVNEMLDAVEAESCRAHRHALEAQVGAC